MTEDKKKNLETQFWGISNLLQGKIYAFDLFIHNKKYLHLNSNG